jgi:glycosyltransferase involved in cell wall biosynthesis
MLISFVVPIYNDGYLAESFCLNYESVFQNYLQISDISNQVELIFVNDGSRNDSLNKLIELSSRFKFVKVVNLSRNFGQHIALSCGYSYAAGEYVGMLNVDQQEPPTELPKLIEYLKNNNFDIVFGLADARKTSFINRITSNTFNQLLNFLTRSKTPLNVTTARVMNRKFVDAYNSLSEKTRYLPGLETWLGFNHGYLPIIHTERAIGKSSYNLKKRMNMAIESILSFSDYPLRLITTFGFIISVIGFLLTIFLLIAKVFFIDFQPGFATTISLITFFAGIQILVIGVASLYIGRILKEVQNRPLFIVRDTYNLGGKD